MVNIFDRERERGAIDSALSKIQSGIPLVLLLEGASGVGKTELMHYVTAHTNAQVLPFFSVYDHYKCSQKKAEAQFSCIAALLTSLENSFPKRFSFHVDNYVSRYSNISLINALVDLVPSVTFFKWSKTALKRANKRPTELYDNLSGHLINNHLLICASEVASNVILDSYPDKPVVICIDDAVWLDDHSLHALFGISKRLENTASPLSFIITTRDWESVGEKDRYSYVDSFIRANCNLIESIFVSNFDPNTTLKFLRHANRPILDDYMDFILDLSDGNPQELSQLLKLNDESLHQKLQKLGADVKHLIRQQPLISKRIIFDEFDQCPTTKIIIGMLSLLNMPVPLESFKILLSKFISKTKKDYQYAEIDQNRILDILINQGILVSLKANELALSHDSVAEITSELLGELGCLSFVAENMASLIITDPVVSTLFPKSMFMMIGLQILKPVNPSLALYHIEKYFTAKEDFKLTKGLAIICSECLLSIEPSKLISKALSIGVLILNSLVNYTSLKNALDLSNKLWPLRHRIPAEIISKYYIDFLRVLIDEGCMESGNMPTGEEVVDIAKSGLSVSDIDMTTLLLLEVSLNEHLLRYKKMQEIYASLEVRLDRMPESPQKDQLTITYLRNKGLVEFHEDIKDSYASAVEIAKNKLDIKDTKNIILLGTCFNNLGLAYFYSKQIDKAKKSFLESKYLLEKIQYDFHRPLNNIAACAMLTGDFSEALSLLLLAKQTPYQGVFEKISIEINCALCLYVLKDTDKANEIMTQLVTEYRNKNFQTPDTWVYAGALYNKGYFEFLEGNYSSSASYYKESMFHKYRFSNEREQSRRKEMINICTENIINAGANYKNNSFIDFKQVSKDIYSKPFDIQLLAFYVV